ncbi:MAG: acyl-CoA dehydrogenase [Pseudomonadota bacterium]
MTILIALLVLLGAGVLLAALGATTAVAAGTLAALTLGAAVLPEGITPIVGLYGALTLVVALLAARPLRKAVLTQPLFRWYRKALPGISDTEREAIDAGTVWWDGDLFSGRPDWDKLLNYGKAEISAEEQAFLDGPVKEVCALCEPWKLNRDWSEVPEPVMAVLRRERFFGMIIPKRYGGLELSAVAQTEVVAQLQACGNAVANLITVPNSLGPGELLLKYGTEEQKNYYLPRLASGEEIPCFALTGPTAGSDATSLPDTGVVCRGIWEGEEVLGLRLNFSKRYITLAPIATLVGLAFRMQDPDGLLGDTKDYGITCALLPRNLEGMDIGRRHMPCGDNFFNGPIFGKDVFIPLTQIIGGAEMAGKGWTMLVNCLSVGRCITLPSGASGITQRALAGTSAYAALREQFGLPISKFEGVQAPLARIAGLSRIARAARMQTAVSLDKGEKPSVASAILKYHCTELARIALTDAMDIHGGKAVIRGPKNYLADYFGGIPIAITVEGANIMTRNLMIFGQGATRSHPYVLKEMQLAGQKDSAKTLDAFDKVFFDHVGFTLSNAARSLLMGLTGGRLQGAPNEGPLGEYYGKLNRLSANFALTADVAMLTLQGRLKFMEMLSARLGDLLSNLYLASMVIKDYEDAGCPEEELPSVQWSLDYLIDRYLTAFDEVLANFPVRPIAMGLRLITHPWGVNTRAPSDRLSRRVAKLVATPTATRESLIQGAVLDVTPGNPLGFVNAVFLEAPKYSETKRRVMRAAKHGEIPRGMPLDMVTSAAEAGILSAEEATALRGHLERVMEIVHVDHFASLEEITASRELTAGTGGRDDAPLAEAS